jgi:branched-chain amino acid transport system permease protein
MTRPGPQHAAAAPALSGPGARMPRRSALWAAAAALVLLCVLAALPGLVQAHTTSLLGRLFVLIILASMWNLLAGYAGLISIGQQAFFGLGSYGVLILAVHGTKPFVAMPAAVVGCAAIGVLVWLLLWRLRSGYFALATLVIAADCYLIISRYPSLGGTAGMTLPGLPKGSPASLHDTVYWLSLGVAAIALACVYLVLRSKAGLSLLAVRDDQAGQRTVGGRAGRAGMLVFVIAAAGCGAAGALQVLRAPFLQSSSAFSVQWSAVMIFAVLIGGIGTIEGPIAGSIVVVAVQQWLAPYGSWSYIVLGLAAVAVAIWLPRGIWGLVPDKAKLLPVGFALWPAGRVRAAPDAGGGAQPEA